MGNLIGTTERITDSQSAIAHRAVYTAFGEPIFPSPSQGEGQGEGTIPTRYGYVGAWGYEGNPLSTGQALEGPGGLCDPAGPEAHCDPVALLGWLHVGERYYDPAGGRFMQRDPIGIRGAWNVYGYVENNPAFGIDPMGLLPEHGWDFMAFAVANREAGIPWEQSVQEWTRAHGWALIGTFGALIGIHPETAAALPCATNFIKRIRVKPAIHPAHHTFPLVGRRRHIQLTVYLKGIKGTQINIRIPLP